MANVLIVDDLEDVADSFAEVVTLFGHETRVAYGGAQALSEVELHAPSVALIDLNMPVMNGYQLARRIRDRWGAGIRLVAHSADPRSSVAADAGRAGFDAFVSKSARPLELALAIQGRRGLPDLRATRLDRRKSLRSGYGHRRSSDGVSHVSSGNAAD